jgi:Peptidase M30
MHHVHTHHYAKALLLSSLTGLLLSCGGGSSGSSSSTGGSTPNSGCGISTATGAPPPAATALTTACLGANCAASGVNSYSGNGVGVWEYKNTGSNDALVNIDISGVSAGKVVASVFSNGEASPSASKPACGTQISYKPSAAAAQTSQNQLHDAFDLSHSRLLEKNHAAHIKLIPRGNIEEKSFNPQKTAIAEPARYAPSINSSRQWFDYEYAVGNAYNTTNKYVCTLASGRKVVFWQDNLDTTLTAARLALFTNASCGQNSGFDKMIALLGEPWGDHVYTNIIQETPSNKQDINVVFIRSNLDTWAGYFAPQNNETRQTRASSNEALVFFINTNKLENNEGNHVSTLFHEFTHMVESYQNYIRQNKILNTWLQETFAMMGEDIINPSVTGYNRIGTIRVPQYALSGAGYSLTDWSYSNQNNNYYNMGASLGAFINRQHGVNVFKQLITGCTIPASLKTDSYACLNNLIIANGGIGLNDAFTKMNSSVFGRIPSSSQPNGYGFPAKTDFGYTLSTIDTSSIDIGAANSFTLYNGLTSTYYIDTVASGKTRYTRSSVLIPAKTNLQVVVR